MQAQMLDGDGFMGFSMYSRMYLLTLGIWTGRAMCLQKALLFYSRLLVSGQTFL